MIVAAYTPGNRYEALAHECKDAWARCGIDVELVPYADRGSFALNCLAFTLAAFPMWNHDGPLFVIGADALPNPRVDKEIVRQEMYVLECVLMTGVADVVCERRPGRQLNMRVHSGIVGWAPSTHGSKWFAEHCRRLTAELTATKPRNDQEILYGVLLDMEAKGGKWHRLPEGFNCKDMNHPTAPILHGHASRGA